MRTDRRCANAMLDLTPSQVAESLLAPLTPPPDGEAPERPITTVVTDSRQVQPGSLFVALAGERVDGHDYLPDAFAAGAAAAIVTRDVPGAAGPTIAVPDAVRALGDRKSTRLNSSHVAISYAVFCLKKKKKKNSGR